MSWTSHSFHVLKDVQSFAAALVAFTGVGITVLIQRWIADRQAKVTLQVAEQSRLTQERNSNIERLRMRLSCCVEIEIAMKSLDTSLKKYSITCDNIIKRMEAGEMQFLTFSSSPNTFNVLFSGPLLIESHEILRTPPKGVADLSLEYMRSYYIIRSSAAMLDTLLALPRGDNKDSIKISRKIIDSIKSASTDLIVLVARNEKKFHSYAETIDLDLAKM